MIESSLLQSLVSLNSPALDAEPFTTSDIIAQAAEIEPRAVRQIIRKYSNDLNEFGVLTFCVSKPAVGSKGGRLHHVYQLNEQQAALVITYLGNTAPVREFKKALVRQFYIAREELIKRRALRQIGKPARQSLNQAISKWEFCKPFSYKNITDLLCKFVTGMTTKQLRAVRGAAGDATGLNLYTSPELAEYQRLEASTIDLLELGLSYDQIKHSIQQSQPLRRHSMDKKIEVGEIPTTAREGQA